MAAQHGRLVATGTCGRPAARRGLAHGNFPADQNPPSPPGNTSIAPSWKRGWKKSAPSRRRECHRKSRPSKSKAPRPPATPRCINLPTSNRPSRSASPSRIVSSVSLPKISTACSRSRVNRSSNPAGCVRSPNPCNASSACRPISNPRSTPCGNNAPAKIFRKPPASRFNQVFGQATEARHYLNERLQELDLYDRRSASLSNRLYLEVLRTRMRPSAMACNVPRMVRDLARSLGKQVRLEILGRNHPGGPGHSRPLEAPLAHLIRNAVDHGCEMPDDRPSGEVTRMHHPPRSPPHRRHVATHRRRRRCGLDTRRVRDVIVRRKLTTPRSRRR